MIAEKDHINEEIQKEPGSFRLIFSLGLAGFFSGLLLVSAYIYTRPLIAENKARALEKAIFEVLPGCVQFETLVLLDGILTPSTPETDNIPDKIYAGYDTDRNLIGFAIPAEEPGFQDIIVAIYGYDPHNRQIIGFKVLESKETPGLGDKIFKDAAFQENFRSLAIEPALAGVKKGAKTSANEVETITGATISSKAVINMLSNSTDQWKLPVDSYLNFVKENEGHE